jgi:hypothetical protein
MGNDYADEEVGGLEFVKRCILFELRLVFARITCLYIT